MSPSLAGSASAGVNTWTSNGPAGGEVTALAIDPNTPTTVYAATRGLSGTVFKSTDGGGHWRASGTGLPDYPATIQTLAIDPANPASVYAGFLFGGYAVYKSSDGGGSWVAVNTGLTYPYVEALAIDPTSPATVYAGTSGGGVFKSSNGGQTWTAMNVGLTFGWVTALEIDSSAPATLYAATYGGGVFKSTNGGGSWTAFNTGFPRPTLGLLSLAIDPHNPSTLYAGATFDGAFKSTNGGSWRSITNGLTDTDIWAFAIDPSASDTIYAGTGSGSAGFNRGGVFKSTNGGASWTAMNAGLPGTDVRALAIDPSAPARLYAGTAGAGVFDYQRVDPCLPDTTSLCLNGGRFKVSTQWTTRDGQGGSGRATALTGDTGYFTFFDLANVEMLVKILNGCAFNSRFWTFAGGLTDVSVVMTVTDSETGAVKTYTNPQGTAFQPIQDPDAFVSCASGTAATQSRGPAAIGEAPLLPPTVFEWFDALTIAPCVADGTTLCLNNSRYRVQTQWFTRDGSSGAGQVIPLTGDTGAFWFFSSGNVEMVIKVLDGCGVNSRYWTFAGGLTDVNVILTVSDTQTGSVKAYTNPQGTPLQPIQDTSAFATCP